MSNVINRALIVNPYPLEQHALEDIVKSTNLFQHIHFATSAAEAYRLVNQLPVNFILLEVEAYDASGLDILRRLRTKGFTGKILFIGTGDKAMYSNSTHKLGANGYLLKSEELPVIQEAIASVMRGYNVFKHESRNKERYGTELSKRETVVYHYLLAGMTNKKISELLSISSKTVSTYKTRILTKFGVKSVFDLINQAKIAA
ncbi:response regulator transcription factor [Vibrio fluvialis]|jgi:two-component system response regulator FimZ (fimbrial Z protein)|uniref:response regulator transcription factor n=1 Tax=Vibrio fluvialis TaxID=676 RepID=UPI000648DF7F|nr:response regulator transcription factor [Vibrio fluvialis]EKO3368538.1 response regulator transcription factor [Vibrio fluvialis]EKO3416033.1 response regulator transcription factor [Vibrio fluvialis]EKO3429385.1 response regulator transcription factor [Vibrio fluvialis]EKO3441173.1 response regulator transcription factor [Vibrio fluvialis]EKO3445770.1 response regulator transcription factor [Vibrio fluvialis]